MRYLDGLVKAIMRRGVKLFTGTHAESVEGTSTQRVRTASGRTVSAKSVVLATNAPVWDGYGIYTLQAAYRTYAIGARLAASMQPALFWDTADPYHYVRLAGDVLIVGGEDHRTGQREDTDSPFACLEDWTRERFPIGAVEYRWSGQVLEPVDGMAFIGRFPMSVGNLFVATGDSGHGMTHGTIAGMLLADLIQGKRNHWSKLYDPSRITASALGEYTTENLNVVAQYREWVTGGDVDSVEEIAPGSGATVRHGAQKTAVYRDTDGKYHEFSAVCPHLGGIVAWNETEKSWDCPCHGSRFDCVGKLLNGPANRGLDPQDSLAPLVTTAGTGLQTAALMTANGLKKLLTLGIRIGA
jgi:Rieske Fe-S protein